MLAEIESFVNWLRRRNPTARTWRGHRWLETTQIYVLANDRQVQADYYAACRKLDGWL